MYCKGKWCTAGGKDPLLGRVDGFQIGPKIFRKDFNCPKGMKFIWDLFCDFFPYKSQNWQRHQAMPSWLKLGSIWKPLTRPNSGSFPPAVHHFPLQYTKYSCERVASSGGKSLAVGHISGFQIDPKIFSKDFNCPKGTEFIWDVFCDFFPYKSQNGQRRQTVPFWLKSWF